MTNKRIDRIARNNLNVRLENDSLQFDVEAMLAGIMEAIDADFTNFIRSWNLELTHVRNTTDSDTTKSIALLLQQGIFEFSNLIIFLSQLFVSCRKSGLDVNQCAQKLVDFQRDRMINFQLSDVFDNGNDGKKHGI